MNLRLISWMGVFSVVGFACANGTNGNEFARGGGAGRSGNNGGGFGVGGSGSITPGGTAGGISTGGPPTIVVKPDGCAASKTCQDFPADPILDTGVTMGDVGGFGDPNNLGGTPSFCLMEPQLSNGTNPGAMFPANWLTPRFRWDGGASGAIFEIRLHATEEAHDLVVYTKSDHWIMPSEIWNKFDSMNVLVNGVGNNARHVDVTVRSLAGGAMTGMKGGFEIAPVTAGGTMVYWGTTSSLVTATSSFLVGFQVGNPAVAKALTLQQVNGSTGMPDFGQILNENGKDLRGQYDQATDPNSTIAKGFLPGQVQCIGCHIQLPDKKGVIFTDDWPWNKIVASTESATVGTTPSYVTSGARAILKQPGLGTSTAANNAPMLWSDTNKIIITSYYQDAAVNGDVHVRVPYNGQSIDTNKGIPPAERLIWINLATTANIPDKYGGTNGGLDSQLQTARNAGIIQSMGNAWNYIPISGEQFPANILPNLSADGSLLVYTAANASQNGGLHKSQWTEADLHYVKFDGGNGGAATPVPGASEAGVMEYYPAWSPDNAFIAFTRVADRTTPGYYNPFGEINITDKGGNRIRLAANDPVACSREQSPGVFNSWPKWAPNVKKGPDGSDFYFVIFSSARKYPNPVNLGTNPNNVGIVQKPSQLYVAAIVKDSSGNVTTYPAIYLWNQGYQQVGTGATATAELFQTNNLTPAWDEFSVPIEVTIPPDVIK